MTRTQKANLYKSLTSYRNRTLIKRKWKKMAKYSIQEIILKHCEKNGVICSFWFGKSLKLVL